MKTGLTFTLLLSVLVTAPGCSKFRQLTRRDYASLNDPFVDKSAAKSETETGLKTAATGSAVASANGATGETEAAPSTAGRTTAAQNDPAAFGGVRARGVSNAIAGSSGPSLEDFISTETGPATAATTAATNAVASSRATPDSAEFAAFLGEQAEASGLTQTARELDDGFLEFANNKKKEWQQRTAQAADAAAAVKNPLRQVSQSVTQNAQTALSPAARPSVSTETAVPLIRQASAARAQAMPAPVAHPPVERPLRDGNPFADQMPEFPEFPEIDTTPAPTAATPASFATRTRIPGARRSQPEGTAAATDSERPAAGATGGNPFLSFEQPSVSKNSAQKSPLGSPSPFAEDAATQSSGQFLDSGFNFDSGWKPPSMQRP